MEYEKHIIKKEKLFIRVSLNSINVNDIFKLLSSKKFDAHYAVYIIDNIETRYKLPKINNKKNFLIWINSFSLFKIEEGVDSGNANFFLAVYVDSYYTLFNE